MARGFDDVSAECCVGSVVEDSMDMGDVDPIAADDVSEDHTEVEDAFEYGAVVIIQTDVEKAQLNTVEHSYARNDRRSRESFLRRNRGQRLDEALPGIEANKDIRIP